MAAVQRQGDANSAGGVAQGGASSVLVNGRPIMVPGMSVTPHPPCGQKKAPPIHCNATTSGGSGTVKAEGKPVIMTGDVDTCGHARSGGSSDVTIG
jgi:uncharacterized Zn-binding protein involved in type VI secretion